MSLSVGNGLHNAVLPPLQAGPSSCAKKSMFTAANPHTFALKALIQWKRCSRCLSSEMPALCKPSPSRLQVQPAVRQLPSPTFQFPRPRHRPGPAADPVSDTAPDTRGADGHPKAGPVAHLQPQDEDIRPAVPAEHQVRHCGRPAAARQEGLVLVDSDGFLPGDRRESCGNGKSSSSERRHPSALT